MKPRIDLTGVRFGRLTALHPVPRTQKDHSLRWACRCDCGNLKEIRGDKLRSGAAMSCGCLRAEVAKERNTTHGLSRTREYYTWASMHRRCGDPNHRAYKHYGGRGVTVCPEWSDFLIFLSDMGERPSETTLDRVDNNRGYSKENCRWATWAEQVSNTRQTLVYTVKGETRTHAEWARELSISSSALSSRLKIGLSVEQACTLPKHYRVPKLA